MKTLTIQILKPAIVGARNHVPGDVVSADRDRAHHLISHGAAVAYVAPPEEVSKETPETPVRRAEARPKGRKAVKEPQP